MALTPRAFCAVTAVTMLAPQTPNAAKVLRSAWMPAPPLESEPAMVRAIAIGSTSQGNERQMRPPAMAQPARSLQRPLPAAAAEHDPLRRGRQRADGLDAVEAD